MGKQREWSEGKPDDYLKGIIKHLKAIASDASERGRGGEENVTNPNTVHSREQNMCTFQLAGSQSLVVIYT